MKERLDVILMNQGYATSREKAKAIIMSGNVYVNGQKEDKAGTSFDESKIRLEVRGHALKYVSRGGLKLEKAMKCWPVTLEGKICMDIGSSTGGFTDCMLQNGAVKVYAVDVGHGQLAWKLRNDERVVCMEQTNFRYLKREDIEDDLDFASVENGEMVCLIKPQFEAGREKVGKNGVVREPEVHREVIGKIVDYADSIGFTVLELEYSPIKGPEGNIEYLVHLRKEREPEEAVRLLTEQEAENRLKEIIAAKSGLSQTEEWQNLIRETVEKSHSMEKGHSMEEKQES